MKIARLIALLGLIWLLQAGAAPAARLVAVGDVHGEIDGFDSILRAASLIDQNGNWVGGDAILVQTGDVTDRGPRVRAVMDRLRALQEQAPSQGGSVVVLLGNHEVSNLIHVFDELSTPASVYHQIWADFAGKGSERRQRSAYDEWRRWLQRYPGCIEQQKRAWGEDREAWLAAHPPGFVEYIAAFSASGEYGSWLRTLGVAEKLAGAVFLHGGLSSQLVEEEGYQTVARLNEAAHQALQQLDRDRARLAKEKVILPFSSLWETHCALFVEMARLEMKGEPDALARRAELDELRRRLPGMPDWFLTNEHGPLWFRGLAMADETAMAPEVDRILEAFDADRIAVGHTPQTDGKIHSRFGGRVYLLDTAMAYPELGGTAAALEIDGGLVTAIYPGGREILAGAGRIEAPPPVSGASGQEALATTNRRDDLATAESAKDQQPVESTNGHRESATAESIGGQEPLESAGGQDEPPAQVSVDDETEDGGRAARPQVWLGANGQPLPFTQVDEILDFLATAKIKDTSKIDTGVTLPRKVLLEQNGVSAHAIFHNIAIEKRRERLRGGQVINFFRDHYANNLAAFELSKMLGMDNVPPGVVRRVGRDKGSLHLWIENSITEAERRQQHAEPSGDWRLTAKDMVVFDNLTNNIDRNQGNILYDADWNLWFIDHTRAFGRTRQLPTPDRIQRCSRRLYEALRDLDEAEVRSRLKPYLGIYEIDGLMARRDLVAALLEERMTKYGEFGVLFDYDDSSPAIEGADEEPDIPPAPPD